MPPVLKTGLSNFVSNYTAVALRTTRFSTYHSLSSLRVKFQ